MSKESYKNETAMLNCQPQHVPQTQDKNNGRAQFRATTAISKSKSLF